MTGMKVNYCRGCNIVLNGDFDYCGWRCEEKYNSKNINDDSSERIIEQIYREALNSVDTLASYHHYLVWGEIKVIYKDREQQ